MNEHKCEKCEHEKECLNMVCFYELLEKEEEKNRADEREKVLEECKRRLLEDLIPLKDTYFALAKGTSMPERYVQLKRMDTVELIIEMVNLKLEQLKEQTGEGRKVD